MRTLIIFLCLLFYFQAFSQTALVGKSLRVGPTGTYTKGRVTGYLNADSTSTVTLVSARVVTNEINKAKAEVVASIQGNALTVLSASTSFDPPSIAANGGSYSTTLTVTGAVMSGVAIVNHQSSGVHSDFVFKAQVTAANTVTIMIHNVTAFAVDQSTMTFNVIVLQ